MTDEQIRIKVAEACGWVWYRIPNTQRDARIYRMLAHPDIHEYEGQAASWLVRADGSERVCNTEYMWREGFIPNYPADLNAMHDAEATLTSGYWDRYAQWLRELTHSNRRFLIAHATARQRAEAFLRVKGLWEEAK